jgi:hypothetical protein
LYETIRKGEAIQPYDLQTYLRKNGFVLKEPVFRPILRRITGRQPFT